MTCEEALRIFKGNCSGCFLKDKYCKECKTHMAIEALEKQIKKIPRRSGRYGVCPNCSRLIERYEQKHGGIEIPHCKWCGQKLDWSDEE